MGYEYYGNYKSNGYKKKYGKKKYGGYKKKYGGYKKRYGGYRRKFDYGCSRYELDVAMRCGGGYNRYEPEYGYKMNDDYGYDGGYEREYEEYEPEYGYDRDYEYQPEYGYERDYGYQSGYDRDYKSYGGYAYYPPPTYGTNYPQYMPQSYGGGYNHIKADTTGTEVETTNMVVDTT